MGVIMNYNFVPNFFEFELDEQGGWDSVDFEGCTDEIEDVLGKIVEEWVNKDYIPKGEKTIGKVWKEDGYFVVTGEVCTELGEDWNDDKWDNFEVKILF